MSNNPSATTQVISFRVTNEMYNTLLRRAKKQELKLSDYVRSKVIWDAKRSHKKKEE
ncbi:hypothetical protein LCGC14_0365370 [marine sediment metagenome]|uniref:Uncharacterized protein n=1 Tax=marine sediment metagenome TaxID=412755 RepID=A0A0F9VTV8_9ZZZZ